MSNIHDVPRDQTFDKYDVIDRKPYSEHLTDFLNSKAKDGYVLNLNAEWGAGKTTFLQCWYNELKEKHPVVYFDAWKSDFTHDAMLAITECFHSQLMSPLVEDKERLTQLKDKGAHLLKVALPSLLVGYLKHKTGTDSDDSLLGDISKEFCIEIDDDDLGEAVKETMKAMLNQKKKVDAIYAFRKALEDLANCYLDAHTDVHPPIYVLVDELDRCRPTYAIEVIESIKHFFNTKKFIFILATDTNQLQHSIKAVYGNKFDASAYLSRFFDRTAVLPSPPLKLYIRSKLTSIIGYYPEYDFDLEELYESIFLWHGVYSLRDVDKILLDIEVASAKSGSFKVLPLLILSILKHRFPEHFYEFQRNKKNPYQNPESSVKVSREDFVLPKQHTPIAQITTQKKESISSVLFRVINGLTNNVPFRDYSTYVDDPCHSHATLLAVCQAIAGIYVTTIDTEFERPLIDYFSVLNFAGHLMD
ncbi:hypothetical protein RAX56_002132 [Vibrio fluvialis]|nr:hypothetical protein [Vibrio fluvialis]